MIMVIVFVPSLPAHASSGMKAHVEPSCQSLFGLWLSPWIYTWSYSEISTERSQAFWKRLYLCYSDSHVENPHFSHEKINVQSCELSNKRRPNLKLTSINTVRYALSRYIVKLIKLGNLSKCHVLRISYYY